MAYADRLTASDDPPSSSAAPQHTSESADNGARVSPISKPERRTYTVDEAAEILGISRSFAYELVKRRELPARCLGRRIVIPKRALDDFLDGGSAGTTRDSPHAPSEVSRVTRPHEPSAPRP
jgi:excisionase family DNA binding protein